MNLCFTCESCDTLKPFNLFITVKISNSKLTLEHSGKFEMKFKKLTVVVHVLQTTCLGKNLVISRRCCYVEDGKEMYLTYKEAYMYTVYYTVIKHGRRLRTGEKYRKHSSVLSRSNTRLRLFKSLYDIEVMRRKQ